jgi:hypothetical protein
MPTCCCTEACIFLIKTDFTHSLMHHIISYVASRSEQKILHSVLHQSRYNALTRGALNWFMDCTWLRAVRFKCALSNSTYKQCSIFNGSDFLPSMHSQVRAIESRLRQTRARLTQGLIVFTPEPIKHKLKIPSSLFSVPIV